jgi:hypothetical protein
MRVFDSLIAAALLLATSATAQEPRPPIRSFDLSTTEALGRAMFRQDSAAWVATDALRSKVPDFGAAHLVGWIVEDHGGDQRVRFLRDVGRGVEAGYDVDVDRALKTQVSEPTDRTLTTEEIANFAALKSAAANMNGQPVCRPGYNHVVLKDPGGDGWLVWLLAPTPKLGAMPVGGHYRFTVSPDGRTVTRRDALSASCMVTEPAPKGTPADGKLAASFVTHVVSATPVETHVFLQIQSGLPLFVGAGARIWAINAGHITDQGPIGSPKTP